eukprot:g3600.t1
MLDLETDWPVVWVSWRDVTAYAEWLGEQLGQHCRLPTEAEWEYAAKAGSETAFPTGANLLPDQANYLYDETGSIEGIGRLTTPEPLFISEAALAAKTADLKSLGHEIVAYPDRVEDDATIIQRGLDADIVITGNLPLSADVTRPTRQGKTRAGLVGSLLKGKTVGIVGTGAIGIRTAELCKAFGCKLLAYSRSQRQEAIDLGMEYVSLEKLLSESDIVSLHLPLAPGTQLLIGAQEIALMKSDAIILNVARGGVLDSQALADALNNGTIGGAAIDVFETEPPLDTSHPLLHSANTIVAPHVAFASAEAFDLRADIVFDHIRNWLQ